MVNGKDIYPLPDTKPVVIAVQDNNPRIVITDGFHITRPLKLVYKDMPVTCFKVSCSVNDLQLGIGFGLLVASYLGAILTGLFVLKLLSFLPLVYLLIFYYLNREDFLKLVPVAG